MSASICIRINILQVIDPQTHGMVWSLRHQRRGKSVFACGAKVYDDDSGFLRVFASTALATRQARDAWLPCLGFAVYESWGCGNCE